VPARKDGGKAAVPRNVISLMDALRQSIAAAEKKAAAAGRAKSVKNRA
jgi:non-homologous end joining protein Ku